MHQLSEPTRTVRGGEGGRDVQSARNESGQVSLLFQRAPHKHKEISKLADQQGDDIFSWLNVLDRQSHTETAENH